MITLQELNPKNRPLTEEQAANLTDLLVKINVVRAAYGKPMVPTSGFRSWEEHVDIYIRNGSIDFNPLDGSIKLRRDKKFPKKSSHLDGNAVDIRDRDGKLWGWLMDNFKLLEEQGLYLEDKSRTPYWVHFQRVPPKSGNRIFLP